MNVLFIILTVVIVLAAILLIIVVLLQNGKGAGMASNFVAGNQTLGVRQTADIIDITDKIENVTDNAQPAFPSAPIQQEAPTTEGTPEAAAE